MIDRNYGIKQMIALVAAAIVMTGTIVMVKEFHAFTASADQGDKAVTCYAVPGTTVELDEDLGDHVIYLSSDRGILDIGTKGTIKAKTVGTADLRMLDLDTKKMDKVRVRIAHRQTITTAKDHYVAIYGDKPLKLGAKTDADDGSKLIYKSDDPKIASVDENGNVKIGKAGKTSIHIRAEATENYHGTDKDVVVTVGKKGAAITTDQTAYSMPATGEKVKIEAKATGKGDIVYESENPEIATVDEEGNIVPVSAGVTKIKVLQKESANFEGAETAVDVEITKPTASDRALAAVAWAMDIANDDSFAYGSGSVAHKKGCYFCGTNQKYKPAGYEKTYCCNPFIFAAYAHGAQDPDILASCQRGGCGGMDPSDWTPYGFECLGSVSEVNFNDLLPGDVVMSDSSKNGWWHHVWMYCGENQYVEAANGNFGPGSIAVENGADKYYPKYARKGCYVVRYVKE